MSTSKPRNTTTFAIWFGYVFFVVYGSLVPLDFTPLPLDQAWAVFQHIPMYKLGVESRADWISNGVLYVPVGFLTAHLLIQKFSDVWRFFLLFLGALFSFALAFGVEFSQFFFPPRTVSQNDIFAECVGSLMGLILAARYSDWFKSLLHSVLGKPGWLALRLVEAYLAGYVVFSLFPFDILLTRGELEQKILEGSWGLLLAEDGQGKILITLKLIAEIILTLPFGLFLGYRTVRPSFPLRLAAWLGFLLGCFIEIAQFFTASGVSQGLSILTRVLGVCGGMMLWRDRASWSPERVVALANRYAIPIVVIYVLALLQVNGWFTHGWNGPDFAVSQFRELHFLPFYYHYFTTEAKALFSLASVCLMYLPIGLLIWSKDRSPSQAFIYAFFASGIIEAGKLFLQDLHPDPTNPVLGALASSGVVYLARELSKAAGPAHLLEDQAEQPPMPARKQRLKARSKADHQLPYWVMFAVLAFVAYWAATYPAQPVFLSIFLFLSAVTIWSRPAWLIVILPAALPLLDIAPWSGRFFFDEFDLLIIVCLVVGYTRIRQLPSGTRHTEILFRIASGLLFISFAISAFRGLSPWHMLDANTFSNYYSPFNALRITKAALWAFLLYGLLARIVFAGHNVPRLFASGMVIGVAGTLLLVVWERITFPGLLNFSDVYRVTGPFSQMHVGGADVETYLTIGTPFLVMLLFEKCSLWLRIACALLLLVTTYGVMVTFSRVGYLGFSVAFTLALIAEIMRRSESYNPIQLFKRAAIPLILFLAVLGVGTPIFFSQFAQERLALISTDLAARQNHWEAALRMRDADWATTLLGMGVGRYPETHFWRSNEKKAAPYWLGTESENTILKLGVGSAMYVEQFISVQQGVDYVVDLNVRGQAPDSQLTLSICEKWLLTSGRCSSEIINFNGSGSWNPVKIHIASGELGQGSWYARRPVKFSLYNSSQTATVEVDNIRMTDVEGSNLLSNGDFSQQFDHWFFSVDNDLPWHIWSFPIQILFDQGWLGMIAFGFFVIIGLWRAGRQAWRGSTEAGVFLAAGTGFVVIGTLDSLIDSPRLLLLFLLVLWLCWRCTNLPRPRGPFLLREKDSRACTTVDGREQQI